MTTTKTQVSEAQAQAVLEAIRNQFRGYIDALEAGPVLIPDLDREWTIVWEEGSPYDWPFMLGGGVDVDMVNMMTEFMSEADAVKGATHQPTVFPAGVYVEPVNHISVGIYLA